MGIKMEGFDKFQKELKKMEQNAKKLSQKKNVPFSELFTQKFMRQYTKFSSISELLDDCGYGELSQQEFEAIPEKEIDAKISERTKFKSWQEMLNAAGTDYVSSQLFP